MKNSRPSIVLSPLCLAPLMLAPLAALTACGTADNDPGPGGVSAGEARALDEAAEMIEKKRLPAEEIEEESETAQQPAEKQEKQNKAQ